MINVSNCFSSQVTAVRCDTWPMPSKKSNKPWRTSVRVSVVPSSASCAWQHERTRQVVTKQLLSQMSRHNKNWQEIQQHHEPSLVTFFGVVFYLGWVCLMFFPSTSTHQVLQCCKSSEAGSLLWDLWVDQVPGVNWKVRWSAGGTIHNNPTAGDIFFGMDYKRCTCHVLPSQNECECGGMGDGTLSLETLWVLPEMFGLPWFLWLFVVEKAGSADHFLWSMWSMHMHFMLTN